MAMFYEIFILILICVLHQSKQAEIWEKPGCHKIGYSRKISIPDCSEFRIATNACRGFCESWSMPSSTELLFLNRGQTITSIAQCCNMMDTEDVTVHVLCLDGVRQLTFKSAVNCSCYHCKKN